MPMSGTWRKSKPKDGTPMSAKRFLAAGPDSNRRAFIALALGATATVVMPLPPAIAGDEADGEIEITTPCTPAQTFIVTEESCEIVEIITPVEMVEAERSERHR
jgi:hypothetical protein